MTQAEFFAYAQIYDSTVNVWYSDTTPCNILGVTIPVLAPGLPVGEQDISSYLSQVNNITLPLPTGELVTLDVLTRYLLNPLSNSPYYYFDVVPYLITPPTYQTIVNGAVSISPSINGEDFNASPYNILQGLVETQRQSTYIVESDRYKVGTVARPTYTGPINIDSILSGSATKASVQDSLYSDTGWSNSRYNGTKTSQVDFKVVPSITGRTFEASEYPLSTLNSQIRYQQSGSQVVYSTYFYSGKGDVPGLSSEYTHYLITGSGYTTTTPYLDVKLDGSTGALYPLPKVGDLVSFSQYNTYQAGGELAYVVDIGIINLTLNHYRLFVTRNIGGIDPGGTPLNTDLLVKVEPVQIYNIQKSQLSGVPKGKLLVKETGQIVTLNSLGFIVSSV